MKSRAISINLVFALALFLAWAPSAYAYIDPGTGSLWLQVTFSIILGLMLSVKLYWRKIKNKADNIIGHKEITED